MTLFVLECTGLIAIRVGFKLLTCLTCHLHSYFTSELVLSETEFIYSQSLIGWDYRMTDQDLNVQYLTRTLFGLNL